MILMTVEPSPVPIDRGLVEIDADSQAERYAILDRNNLMLIATGKVPASNIVKVIVPHEYTTGNRVMALILDDAGTPLHYVAGNDKIQANVADARTAIISI